MKTVHEVSKISGVSIRALHHYDAIGLLKPTKVTEAGYRLYDEDAIGRLHTILMFRELGFSLNDIKAIMDNPDFDLKAALSQHIEMLKLQRNHIDGLITQAYRMMKGEDADFSAFDKSNMEKFAKEVKERWGNTDAYRESLTKTKSRSKSESTAAADVLMKQFVKFGEIRNNSPYSDEAQNAVKELQDCITANFYLCTNEILAGLGEMYTADERFRKSIDEAGGDGTASFVSEAIKHYCK